MSTIEAVFELLEAEHGKLQDFKAAIKSTDVSYREVEDSLTRSLPTSNQATLTMKQFGRTVDPRVMDIVAAINS